MSLQDRILQGAADYAASDRSYPFAYARCMAHIRAGLCGIDKNGEDSFYKATPFQEKRVLPNGEEYYATVWRNVARV